MIRILVFLIFIMSLIVSCSTDTGIPFDESMSAIQDAGHSLSTMNTADMKCLQGGERDGTRVVFMQVYCAIEDQIDMMNFAINPAYSPRAKDSMRQVLELIGFPYSVEVIDFISENEDRMNQGG